MGIPTLTVSRDSMSSRIGTSIMRHVGAKAFAHRSWDDAVRFIVQQDQDPTLLQQTRGALRQNLAKSVICTKRYVNAVEDGYRAMFKDWTERCPL